MTSPDGCVSAVLTHPSELDVTFTPGCYGRYREDTLERQLAAVATGLWAGHRRGFLAALSEALGEPARGDGQELDSERDSQGYREAVAAVVADRRSPSGRIRATTTALVRWDFEISPGTVRALSEEEFRQELLAVGRATLDDFFAQVRELKDEHYGRPESRFFDPWADGRISA
ncbi:hypothetical protein ACTMTJ_25825 [Phytohabitans sp. LJ34]|uniref:hypothetical protein n=1 Tax=Phytohabitans sp. LJ34 TaxID=3452217 RepID=UPI003F88A68C